MAQPATGDDETTAQAYQKGFADGRVMGYQQGLEAAQNALAQMLYRHRRGVIVQAMHLEEDTPIEKLGLRIQSQHALMREGIATVNTLARTSLQELRAINGLGPILIGEIVDKLAELHIELPPKIIDRIPR